eukprot:Cvel_14159.t1-p1 / transcript=Cvel_14159.t1 / gene=Cvel_14159 / organism=Chromera_velia_CCMP2878 / gene_product=hypothetical protein / transcript_product=hypothetical protein / location=Cvel_scaffold997:48061-51114(+) / protein_length=189 / sequence_SO=supercontig / SO=protein_coding / is_pseudo=false
MAGDVRTRSETAGDGTVSSSTDGEDRCERPLPSLYLRSRRRSNRLDRARSFTEPIGDRVGGLSPSLGGVASIERQTLFMTGWGLSSIGYFYQHHPVSLSDGKPKNKGGETTDCHRHFCMSFRCRLLSVARCPLTLEHASSFLIGLCTNRPRPCTQSPLPSSQKRHQRALHLHRREERLRTNRPTETDKK